MICDQFEQLTVSSFCMFVMFNGGGKIYLFVCACLNKRIKLIFVIVMHFSAMSCCDIVATNHFTFTHTNSNNLQYQQYQPSIKNIGLTLL